MTLPQNVEDRIQKLSDRKLSVWQEMASTWLPGSTAPINADAFLSLIAEVRRCRAHLMSQEAEITRLTSGNLSYAQDNANLMGREHVALKRANLAESRLAAANALLRKCRDEFAAIPRSLGYDFTHLPELDAHLQGAGDETQD